VKHIVQIHHLPPKDCIYQHRNEKSVASSKQVQEWQISGE